MKTPTTVPTTTQAPLRSKPLGGGIDDFVTLTASGMVSLPSLALVPVHDIEAVMAVPQARLRIWELLDRVAEPDALEVLDQLAFDDLKAVVKAWEDYSSITVGEVMQMVKTARRHADALEADLIRDGLRLRNCPSPEFTWRDLRVYVRSSPITSTLFGELFPDLAGWTRENMLLADIADSLHWLQWAQTKDGRKGRNKPRKIPRPGVVQPKREGSAPKPTPLSVLKAKMAARYATAKRHVTEADRTDKLKQLFGGR